MSKAPAVGCITPESGNVPDRDRPDRPDLPRNRDFKWDLFDAEWYRRKNYLELRDDDRQFIVKIRDFFADSATYGGIGLDIGSGPNLYPAFAMLPFCSSLNLIDLSVANVEWMRDQLDGFDPSWDPFWATYRERQPYATVVDPRARLAEIAHAGQGSVFDLPAATWDLGTMFFVACSISAERAEFDAAVDRFVRALKPGSPFAMAFMVKSAGYPVNDLDFPAVSIDRDDVEKTLTRLASAVHVEPIHTSSPLRPGYGGMILATGLAQA